MWFECTNTTKDINIITNWVPYERTFKAHRFTYGAQSGEWYVEFIWLAGDQNSLTESATWLCTYLYINIAILNVYMFQLQIVIPRMIETLKTIDILQLSPCRDPPPPTHTHTHTHTLTHTHNFGHISPIPCFSGENRTGAVSANRVGIKHEQRVPRILPNTCRLSHLMQLSFLFWLLAMFLYWACDSFPVPSLIARFMGPSWGPSGADRTQVGPMLAPWTLLSGLVW